MRLAAELRPVFARILRASRGIGEGHGQITVTESVAGFSFGPVGATALGPFREVLPESLLAKMRLQLASCGRAAGGRTAGRCAAPDAAHQGTGPHGMNGTKRLPEASGDIGEARRTPGCRRNGLDPVDEHIGFATPLRQSPRRARHAPDRRGGNVVNRSLS
jgi:hypothetical protein